jgi:hypothetical protein
MKTTSLITITVIAGVILLVTGTSMAFAQANTRGPGQSGANPGQSRGGPAG